MKGDLKQVNAIAKEFRMINEQRKEFGRFLETEKAKGRGGSKNVRGDYTYAELRQKAQEFLNS
ncbi:MAG: hypothetical protein VKL42_05905 [Snowella sp.]|nr:hypothetical protein [Snowella sp.]